MDDNPLAPEPAPSFTTWQCQNPTCGLRFSTLDDAPAQPRRCPLCRAPLQVMVERAARLNVPERAGTAARGPEMEVVLDNIRSAWNVGSMLRSADGAGVRFAHLCGVTALPDNPKVWKTSLGAEKSLPWSYTRDGVAAARAIREAGTALWALEGGPRAEALFEVERPTGRALALVVGNELSGVDPGILDLCERVVCLPMQGVKGSLNVAVAFGAAVYALRFGR